jgi:glucose/mannose-6-phosphate isomerase
MINLDSPEEIEKFDKGKVLASIRLLPDQVEQAWEETKKLSIPKNYLHCKNVVICGMGGSALGGRIIDSFIVDRVNTPIETFTEYDLPHYVGKGTLVVASSYSGNTEETISAANQAIARKAKIVGITTGGKLAALFKKEKLPVYIVDPKANPSDQPRMALGYSIAAVMGLLSKCGFIYFNDEDIYQLAVTMRNFTKEFEVDVHSRENLAKKIAEKMRNKIPILIASAHLVGVAHAFKNQLNENSKVFSVLFDIPELNHHLMEGLKNPGKARELLHFLLLNSELYLPRISKRYELTADVIKKNGYTSTTYSPRSDTKISQIFEILTLSSFTSFYLAALYGCNPIELPWVDYFKEKLAA